MVNKDRRDIQFLLEHFRGQAWFKTALAEWQADKDKRTEIAKRMSLRAQEWEGHIPSEQASVIAKIKAEIIAEMEEE